MRLRALFPTRIVPGVIPRGASLELRSDRRMADRASAIPFNRRVSLAPWTRGSPPCLRLTPGKDVRIGW